MERREKIALSFWLFLSFFVCIESLRLGVGSFMAPGPGFLTFGVSLFIVLSVFFLFLKERGGKLVINAVPLFQGKKMRNVIYTLCALFAYALLLDKLGFLLCTLFFIVFSLKIISPHKWRVVCGISVGATIASYVLFNVLLNLQLPNGRWMNHLIQLIEDLLWN